jgi:hypothetical protein
MSLIGTAIGALVALLPRPVGRLTAVVDPELDELVRQAADEEIERLRRENERLTRSHARLVDHIETLEREILLEQHICAHWKEEAERLAKHAIASRLRAEAQEQAARARQRPSPAEIAQYLAQAQMNAALAQQQNLANQQHQNLANQQHQNLANQQHQLANYAGQAQGLQGAYEGFCNCVPSRAQVWGAMADRGEG